MVWQNEVLPCSHLPAAHVDEEDTVRPLRDTELDPLRVQGLASSAKRQSHDRVPIEKGGEGQ